MVANGASSAKKCPANIRTASVHAPVLVSPISVAQRNKMMETEGLKKSTNWMRDQWVANLKKKRMAAAANGGVMPTTTTDASPTPVHRPAPTTTKRTTNKGSRARNKTQTQALPSLTQPQMVDKDNLGFMHPALFFNDLGSFEIESQSFMRLTPSRDSAMVHPLLAGTPNGKQSDRKWSKPLIKKRTNSFSLDVTEPKRRTPRRPHSSNASFDDIDSLCLSSSASSSCSSGFSSVGTPSNFSAEVARMWGPEFDFQSAYVDTFLDIPTPKSAATQLLTPRGLSVLENPRDQDLEQPKLIRTTSVEQEGLSHYLEHTSIANEGANATNERPKKTAYHITAAAASSVDECFGKTVPLPSPSLRQLLVNGARVQRTPRGFRITPRHSTHEYNFDHTSMPEFETLLDEYKFTDIDQELDSFYLDTIESFGGDLDLISS